MLRVLMQERHERVATVRLFAELIGHGFNVPQEIIQAYLKQFSLEISQLKYNRVVAEEVERDIDKLLDKVRESNPDEGEILKKVAKLTGEDTDG